MGTIESDVYAFAFVQGESPAIREAISMARRVSDGRVSTILLVGETGTGKELFARGIHAAGPGSEEAFVPVNCAAIPAGLIESELFGHEKGAFTDARALKKGLLELAGRGTLLLDEITELGPALQAKLLRVLEDRHVRRVGGFEEIPIHCRIIAATNRPLEQAAEDGFREDLLYRLSGFRVRLPPLRDRDGDVPILARFFLQRFAELHDETPGRLRSEAVDLLEAHHWPGNVRELRNVVERAAVVADSDTIGPDDIMIQKRTWTREGLGGDLHAGEIRIPAAGTTLRDIEHRAIEITLRITDGNRSEAARILGISRPTLLSRLRDMGA